MKDDGIWLYCVCDNEWCWCTERVHFTDDEVNEHLSRTESKQVEVEGAEPLLLKGAPEKACVACSEGRHVLEPLGERRSITQ